MAGEEAGGPSRVSGGGEPGLELVGQVTVALSGETYRLVTFLNQALKDQNLIFGLARAADGRATFAVYRSGEK